MTLAAMTAAASQLDNAAPDDVEITDSSAAAEYIADGCLVDGPLGRVGLEMEAHCFDPADPFRRPSWEEITEVLEWLSPLPGGSVVSVEPGGAVELSGPPADGVLAAIGAMTRDQACYGRRLPMPGWVWSSWVQTRCGRRCGSIRAHAIGPWSSFSPPAIAECRVRR